MARHVLWQLALLTLWLSAASAADVASGSGETHSQLLSGDRVLLGTAEDVTSDQAKIDTGEMRPRFIPMKPRADKGLPELKKGDRVEITVNDQNLLVDVHVPGEATQHRVVEGRLAQPLVTGHDKAVIRTKDGTEEPHFIRSQARSKVATIPVGADAVFLIGEADKIIDVTYGDVEAAQRAAELWQKKTPLKGNFSRIVGVIHEPLANNTIIIRTQEGQERSYEVRPLVQERLENVPKGQGVVLLVDKDNKVTDVAISPPASEDTSR